MAGYRDDDAAREAMIASLRMRAEQSDALAARVRDLERENDELRREVAHLRSLQPAPAVEAPAPGAPLPPPPRDDFGDPDLRAARDATDWMMAMRLLGRHADSGDPDRAIAARVQLAHILTEELGDLEEAFTQLQRVLELDPTHAYALARLRELARRSERWAELTSLLEHAVEVTDSSAERVRLLLELAAVCRDELDDEAAAADAYERVLDLDLDNATARAALGR